MLGVDAIRAFSKWKEESPSHSINNNMLLIGMSANASTEDQNEAFEAGMHFFASKPVDVIVLSLLLDTKKAYPDLNESIDVLRTVAMYCEDTGDVYCSQKFNLRSPPSNYKLKLKPGHEAKQDEILANASRLERYVCKSNSKGNIAEELATKTISETYVSTTLRSYSEMPQAKKRFHSESILYTLQRYLCWTRSSKISM